MENDRCPKSPYIFQGRAMVGGQGDGILVVHFYEQFCNQYPFRLYIIEVSIIISLHDLVFSLHTRLTVDCLSNSFGGRRQYCAFKVNPQSTGPLPCGSIHSTSTKCCPIEPLFTLCHHRIAYQPSVHCLEVCGKKCQIMQAMDNLNVFIRKDVSIT